MSARIRIGTRGSPLALAQANEVKARLAAADPALREDGTIEIVVIHTTGDRMTQGLLSAIGGKGLFTKEIEHALIERRIDIAVHSMKDVPTALPDGLMIDAVLPREDPRDAFITAHPDSGPDGPAALPTGAVVGTPPRCGGRRCCATGGRTSTWCRSRGNVNTRLRKLAAGEVAATLLALAGLKRLGLEDKARSILSCEEMLPAVCQGIIGIECRADDRPTRDLLVRLDDPATALAATAERALLAGLDGSCRTPIAALAEPGAETVSLRALLVRPDGTGLLAVERSAAPAEAEAMGRDAARELRGRAGPEYFAEP